MEEVKYVPLVRLTMVKEKELSYMGRISNPEHAAEFARQILKEADREYFVVVSLDNKFSPVAVEIAAIGVVNEIPLIPREVFKHAVLANAKAVILFHNHPSGDCSPSEADRMSTRQMEEAGQLLGIPVEDRIIVGDGYFSFRKEGLLVYV